MKKLRTPFFIFTTIIFGILTYVFYLLSQNQTKKINDRELTITAYKKVIEAIRKSGEIPIDKLKIELKKDFNFNKKISYSDYNKEYYYVLHLKSSVIDNNILNFSELQLNLDKNKKFKTISIYKP